MRGARRMRLISWTLRSGSEHYVLCRGLATGICTLTKCSLHKQIILLHLHSVLCAYWSTPTNSHLKLQSFISLHFFPYLCPFHSSPDKHLQSRSTLTFPYRSIFLSLFGKGRFFFHLILVQ
jgi:hypothetical protein